MTTSQGLLKTLVSDMDELKDTIRDAQQQSVSTSTLNNVVELATLRAFSSLETFLQQLFYLCMLNDPSVAGSGSIVPVASESEVELLLLAAGNRREKFLSWLPLGNTIGMADMYLHGNHPFGRLRYRKTELQEIDNLTVVRNAVAHPSDHAREKFVDLAQGKGYPSKRAADFLMSNRSGTPEVLLLLTRAELVAKGLTELADADASAVLEPESPFHAAAKAPPGTFECLGCTNRVVNVAKAALGACPNCEATQPCTECGRRPAPRAQWRRIL